MSIYQRFVFDCDSTLVRIEGVDWLARRAGVGNEVARLTRAAMEGDVPLDAVYSRRLELIKPDAQALATLGQAYVAALVEDAREVISALLILGKRVTLLSAGLRPALLPLAVHLGLRPEEVLAVDVSLDAEGAYVAFDPKNPLTRPGGKRETLWARGLAGPKTLAVGDGVSDLELKGSVGLMVGFGGVVTRERVRRDADIFIQGPGLAPLLTVGLTDQGREALAKKGHAAIVDRAAACRESP